MTLVKKVATDWFPSENNLLEVGQTVDITDPTYLLKQGKVVLASEPTILAAPEDGFICDVCGFKAKNKIGLLGHQRSHK